MKIVLDKDIADTRKTFGRFSGREVIALVLITVLSVTVFVFLSLVWKWPVIISVLVVLPIIVIGGVVGLYEKQGYSFLQMKAMRRKMQKPIIYISTEKPVMNKEKRGKR